VRRVLTAGAAELLDFKPAFVLDPLAARIMVVLILARCALQDMDDSIGSHVSRRESKRP
jgi:hypothetical protein